MINLDIQGKFLRTQGCCIVIGCTDPDGWYEELFCEPVYPIPFEEEDILDAEVSLQGYVSCNLAGDTTIKIQKMEVLG